jgi:hypothetical protein
MIASYIVHAPRRGEPSEDSGDFDKGKTILSMFMPRIIVVMAKNVPPIPTTVMVTPKDTLSMKISFQPREHVTGSPMTSLYDSASAPRPKSTKAIPVK